MNGELPKGWTRAMLDDVRPQDAPIIYGILQPGPDIEGGIRYVRPTEIVRDQIQLGELRRTSPEIAKKYRRATLQTNDIVLTIVGSIGKVALVPPELSGANITQSSSRIRPDPSIIEPLYLKLALKAPGISEQCEAFKLGTGVPRLNLEDVRKLEVPLAPLPEQRRIVAKLEALLGKVDACQQRLAKIPLLLKRFRRSVLAAACSGRLTADWREQNPSDSIEETGSPDGASEIPKSWSWKRLSEIAQVKGGVTKGRKFEGKKTITVPYLRVANVQDGYLDLNEIKQIEVLPEDKEKYHLERGDVLFTEGGDRDKLGRGTLWRGEIPDCIHQNHVFRARLCSDEFNSAEFISLVSRSDFSRRYFFENANQTVNLASINLTTLSALPLPLAPLPEQKEIVRRVESLFALADQIEARFTKAREQVDKLTPSLLAKAFRGELVPQDPNDEPAEKLLERVHKSRTT